MKGNYSEALLAIDKELGNDKRFMDMDNVLHLSRALNLGELAGDSDKSKREQMFQALEEACGQKGACFLAEATYALRLAEDASFEKNEKVHTAWPHMLKAVQLNEADKKPRPEAFVLGTTIPVTRTFLLDTYGYVLFKEGYRRLSRSLFTHCIYVDPNFSSPYLHLAEWYIICRPNNDNATKVAKLCLEIAILLEGKKASLIRIRAETKLGELNTSRKENVVELPELPHEIKEIDPTVQF